MFCDFYGLEDDFDHYECILIDMFERLLTRSGAFTLFVAPPAWGKTRMLIDLHHKKQFKIIFISPLKALAIDFFCALNKEQNVVMIDSYKGRFQAVDQIESARYGLLIATAEMFDDAIIERLANGNYLAVFDEFHLFYYWGQTFREHLFELLMGVTNCSIPILALSATISDEIFQRWKQDFLVGCDELFVIDIGNQSLKYPPVKINYYILREQLIRRFLWSLTQRRKNTIIFFCAYRFQVDYWVKRCERLGLIALGCKGGEVDFFSDQLRQVGTPDVIFATSALSHGVNLPAISEIYIDYSVGNKDFWIQMVGRGGRRGEQYRLFCRDRYFLSWSMIIKNTLLNTIFDVLIRGGLYLMPCKPR